MGSSYAATYAAVSADERVKALALFCPVTSPLEQTRDHLGQEYDAVLQRAGELVSAGREEELLFMHRRGGPPLTISAGTFVDHRAPGGPGSVLQAIEQLDVPLLLVHGGADQVTPASYAERLQERAAELHKPVTYVELPDSEPRPQAQAHALVGLEGRALDAFLSWIEGVLPGAISGAPALRAPIEEVDSSLVSVRTTDRRRLEGWFSQPSAPQQAALLITHDLQGSFGSGLPARLTAAAGKAGFASLAIDRRDHGVRFTTTSRDHSSLDLSAGVTFLKERGFRQVVVVAPGWGGLFAAHFAASTRDEQVTGLALLDAIDSPRHELASALGSQAFDRLLEQARILSAEGHPGQRLTIQWAERSISVSPSTLLSYCDDDAATSAGHWLEQVSIPVLLLRDSGDSATLPPTQRRLAAAARRAGVPVESKELPALAGRRGPAAHSFEGSEDAVVEVLRSWLEALADPHR
jgi:pimeloyl-ACP methyl ester carboxylesterase